MRDTRAQLFQDDTLRTCPPRSSIHIGNAIGTRIPSALKYGLPRLRRHTRAFVTRAETCAGALLRSRQQPARMRTPTTQTHIREAHLRADFCGAPEYSQEQHKSCTAFLVPAATCAGIAFRLRQQHLDRRQSPSLRLVRELRARAHAFAPYRRTA